MKSGTAVLYLVGKLISTRIFRI